MLSLQLLELAQNGLVSDQKIIKAPSARTEIRRIRKNGKLKFVFEIFRFAIYQYYQ
jgi:hypothetical protein